MRVARPNRRPGHQASVIAAAVVALVAASVVALPESAGAAAMCPKGWTPAYLADGTGTGCQVRLAFSTQVENVVAPRGNPSGLIRVSLRGGSGGSGGSDQGQGGSAGAVGVVSGSVSVPAGTVIEIAVGSAGAKGADCSTDSGGGVGGKNPWTQYSGGSGGNAGRYGCSGAGGGGGAASAVVIHSSSGDISVIAAGGGGGGGGSLGGNGGNGARLAVGSGSTSGAPGECRVGDNGGGGGGGGGTTGGAGGRVLVSNPEWVGSGGESGANSLPAGFHEAWESSQQGANGEVVLEWALPGLTNVPPSVAISQASTPFIAVVTLRNVNVQAVTAAGFTIVGKPGSLAPPISASFSAATLQSRGYMDKGAGTFSIPVFGLYQSYTNGVTLSYTLGTVKKMMSVKITTPAWSGGSSGQFSSMATVVARQSAVRLDYGFIELKYFASANTPVVMDTDGEVRWIGPDFTASQPAYFDGSDFFVSYGTSLARIGLDGRTKVLADYSNLGVTGFHHNFDKGRDGILMQVDRGSHVESTIIEAGADGSVKHVWDLESIVAKTMQAGGDDPSSFVRVGVDWLHTNATTYWKAQNELVVSGREDFVMGIDYDTGQLRWLLGDMTKAWAQYPSLRKLALKVTGVAPAGEHAVSITAKGELMMFDNGTASFNSAGAMGVSRDHAVPRKYKLDLKRMTAVETWHFEHAPPIFSPICSSIYELGSSLLIDYASENWGSNIRLLGLDRAGSIAFEYTVPGSWGNGWNASPISLSRLSF